MSEKRDSLNDSPVRIMAHCISYFPDGETSLNIARALACGGACYLEIQFPFSDPFADGTLIQNACATALAGTDAFTVNKGFIMVQRLMQAIAEESDGVMVFLMCYGNTIIAFGVKAFVKKMQSIGVSGLIIPDIPFDSDVGEEIQRICKEAGVHYIPVMVATGKRERLTKLVQTLKPQYLYMSLRAGITGAKTTISDELIAFLSDKLFISTKILGGFGIQKPAQVRALSPYLHACVIGSAFLQVVMNSQNSGKDAPQAVQRACEALLHDS